MKFMTTLNLGLISLSVMAKPILKEKIRIAYDSENASQFYYAPDELNLALDHEQNPKFITINLKDGGINVSAGFKIQNSESLESDIEMEEYGGNFGQKINAISTYYRVNPRYQNDHTFVYNAPWSSKLAFSVNLTAEGAKLLKEDLKGDPSKLDLFSYCYVVEGLSPDLSGEFNYNLKVVYDYFSKLPKHEVSFKEISDSVEIMLEKNVIGNTKYARGADYTAYISRKLIPLMFTADEEEDKYILKTKMVFEDVREFYEFKSNELIRKHYCLKADLKSLH